jgi:tripartite-type tricarboxylate transporter receptor subunit TctC
MIAALAAPALALAFAAAPAAAQTWPTRPLTMVVPFAAGGSSDAIARILAEGLRTELGQPVVVEDLGGAGGMLGASRVAKAAPDGYQFVLGNIGTHSQNQSIYKKPLYDAATDFAPAGLVVLQSFALLTRKDFPADNLKEFIAYAKAHDGTLQYGSGGAGSSNHLACVLLDSAIGITATHVPYRGASEAMADTLAGRLDYQCPTLPTAIPQIKAGAVKALAVLSRTRSPSMPDLRTAEEQGLAGFDITSWYGLFLPRGTPPDIVGKLNRAMVAAVQAPAVRKRLEDIGSDFVPPAQQTPEYLAGFVAAEIQKWAVAIKSSGIQMQ